MFPYTMYSQPVMVLRSSFHVTFFERTRKKISNLVIVFICWLIPNCNECFFFIAGKPRSVSLPTMDFRLLYVVEKTSEENTPGFN